MQNIIVADTSCLILLKKIGHLDLLEALFGRVLITKHIADEFREDLPEYLSIENPKDKYYQQLLERILDIGEASAIALCIENPGCLLIIDESKGRNEARKLGITVTGTLGILIVSKEKGLIKKINPVLDKIRQSNFRISKKLLSEAQKKAGE